MDLTQRPGGRRLLFAALYFSEGAPIGFLWTGLATRWRQADVPIDRISFVLAAIVLPWTFKFLWAPLVDWCQSPRWQLRHWIWSAQALMIVSFAVLLQLDIYSPAGAVLAILMVHATAAATQDVAIDALCIRVTPTDEQGSINAWMQSGQLLGRAAFGGGSLILERYLGLPAVMALLIVAIGGSAILLLGSNQAEASQQTADDKPAGLRHLDGGPPEAHELEPVPKLSQLAAVVWRPRFIGCFLFAFIAPAVLKAFDTTHGPLLVDRGFSPQEVGWITAAGMTGGTLCGSIAAGLLSVYLSRRRFLLTCGAALLATTGLFIIGDGILLWRGTATAIFCIAVAVAIGLFTVALYAFLMQQSDLRLAASCFTAYMAASNGCESWATYTYGQLIPSLGYAGGLAVLWCITLLALIAVALWSNAADKQHASNLPV